jgi:hypothetical protein
MAHNNQAIPASIFGTFLLLFLVWAFVWGPNDLPAQKHLLLGLLAALAAGFLAYFLAGSLGINGTIPIWKAKLSIKASGGMAAFAFVLIWWQSGLAPVKVQKQLDAIKTDLGQIQADQKHQATKDDLADAVRTIATRLQPKAVNEVPTTMPSAEVIA